MQAGPFNYYRTPTDQQAQVGNISCLCKKQAVPLNRHMTYEYALYSNVQCTVYCTEYFFFFEKHLFILLFSILFLPYY